MPIVVGSPSLVRLVFVVVVVVVWNMMVVMVVVVLVASSVSLLLGFVEYLCDVLAVLEETPVGLLLWSMQLSS